ncbi:MAG: glycosyltransferase family 1 protein [Anaerolineae bacterium]|jgi:glycosyltransferase involved in cell wall biosynthesis
MRIGIDYTPAVRQGGGIGRYTRNLIQAVCALDVNNAYTWFVAGRERRTDAAVEGANNVRVRSVPVSDRVLNIMWQRLRLPVPIQLVTGSLDLFHSPDFVLPYVGGIPAILTVHDLSFMRLPQFFVPGFRDYLERAVSRAVQRADHILADSKSTRQDLIELLAVEPDRVSVLYPGIGTRFQRVEDAAELDRVRAKYRLPQRFILGLGTLQPRKNFDGLIDSFQHLMSHQEPVSGGPELHLVLCGGPGWMFEQTLASIEQAGLGARIHLPGFVDDADLPALYSLASVLAFPSWYEGFGLPVLEAMACETPVVAADNSSLPEVVGEAGLMVDAADRQGLAHALERVLADEGLRASLASAGLKQAHKFSWEEAARQLLDLYQTYA